MKKLFLIVFILTLIFSCKKVHFEPEGPTDVRIRNSSSVNFAKTTVNIKDEIFVYGNLNAGGVSDYHRFKTAFPKSFISAEINRDSLSTPEVDYTYMNYFGRVKLTYEVIVENNSLKIKNVILDSSLESK